MVLHCLLKPLLFTERLIGMHSSPYDSQLKALGLERLKLRRLRMDLIICYNVAGLRGRVGI